MQNTYHIFSNVSETCTCDMNMRKTFYSQTGETLHYTRNASHGFNVLDN